MCFYVITSNPANDGIRTAKELALTRLTRCVRVPKLLDFPAVGGLGGPSMLIKPRQTNIPTSQLMMRGL